MQKQHAKTKAYPLCCHGSMSRWPPAQPNRFQTAPVVIHHPSLSSVVVRRRPSSSVTIRRHPSKSSRCLSHAAVSLQRRCRPVPSLAVAASPLLPHWISRRLRHFLTDIAVTASLVSFRLFLDSISALGGSRIVLLSSWVPLMLGSW